MDEITHLEIGYPLTLLLVEHDPGTWKKYIRKVNGRQIIYVLCNKVIYGTLNAAILVYNILVKYFTKWGFKMNLCEPYVWNKDIDESQFTIILHVDDLKLLRVDPTVVTMIINKMKDAYTGNFSLNNELTITGGNVHDYLRMTISFEKVGEDWIKAYGNVNKLIDLLPEDMKGNKETPVRAWLFKTDEVVPALIQTKMDRFYELTVIHLLLIQQGRPNS